MFGTSETHRVTTILIDEARAYIVMVIQSGVC